MKIKTDTKLLTLKNEEIKDENKEAITVGNIVANTLSLSQKNPARCYVLAKKFATEKEVDLKAEDVVFVKDILEESKMSALIAGQIIEILEK